MYRELSDLAENRERSLTPAPLRDLSGID